MCISQFTAFKVTPSVFFSVLTVNIFSTISSVCGCMIMDLVAVMDMCMCVGSGTSPGRTSQRANVYNSLKVTHSTIILIYHNGSKLVIVYNEIHIRQKQYWLF